MKKFIDQYKFKKSVDKKSEDVRQEIHNRIENSNSLVLYNTPYQKSINIESQKLEWMMVPMLPIYRAKIEVNSTEINTTEIEVKLKGNAMFCFFKYLALLLFLIFAFEWIINLVKSFDDFFHISIVASLGPLAGFFILNFMNRSHIKTGHEEIGKLIRF